MRAGLDLDGVLANFKQGFIERGRLRGIGHHFPSSWRFWTEHIPASVTYFDVIWDEVKNDNGFWLSLKPLCNPQQVTFPVSAYVTARPCPNAITEAWLLANGFQVAPVVTVPYGSSKVQALKDLEIDVFVDDNVKNCQEINEGGRTLCLLWDEPENRLDIVGFSRIDSFETVKKFMEASGDGGAQAR